MNAGEPGERMAGTATHAIGVTVTENARFKAKYGRFLLYSTLISLVVHYILMLTLPGLSAPDFTSGGDDTISIEIPDEIVIPPPPEKIHKPVATPVEAAPEEEVEEEITIAETTIEENIPIVPPSIEEQPTFTPYEVAPKLIKGSVKLKYPSFLKKAGIQGTVVLWLLIDETGQVRKVQVQKSSGNKALDDSAVRAYQRARFTPAMSRDRPVKVWVQYPVQFKLN
jgi:protein TonB